MTELTFNDQCLPAQPRILFMGTPEFATPSLRALYEWCSQRGGEVVGVVSQPDRPKGRGKKLIRTPVASLADELGISCYQWPRLNQESYDTLCGLKYDLAIVIAYGKILPQRYLTLPPWGCVNLHASILPAYRGAAPIQWSLIQGERETGVSVMRLDQGMDTGPVAHMLKTEIGPQDTSAILFERLAKLSAQALCETLDRWVDPEALDPIRFAPQPEEGVSYASMLKKEDGVLRWDEPAEVLSCRIRGVTPWPGGQTGILEGTLKILEAEVWSDERVSSDLKIDAIEISRDFEPGVVMALLSRGPLIRCGDGALLLTRAQRPSKKATSGGDLHRGYPLKVGKLLSDC